MPLRSRLLHATLKWLVITLFLLSFWGWDRIDLFASEPARILLPPVWLGLSLYGAWSDTRTSGSGGKNEIRHHRRVFWRILPLLIAWFAYLPFADRHGIGVLLSSPVRWTGLAFFSCAMWLRIESIRAQGKQFSCAVAIQDGHKLATHGPYRWVRHPAYSGVIGMILGLSLTFANLIMAVVMTSIVWLWMESRIRDEERLLLGEFGDDFLDYCKKTRKLIPSIY